MSQLSQEIRDLAASLAVDSETEIAVGHLKEAGLSEQDARIQVLQMGMEKEATEHLVMQGIDIERAVSMVKAAGVDVKSLTTVSLTPEVNPIAEMLDKVASYVEDLEHKVAELEAAVPVPEIKLPEVFTKAASSGALTYEDLEELKGINTHTLEKMASAFGTSEPSWDMGQGSGMARPKTDAILEFCLG